MPSRPLFVFSRLLHLSEPSAPVIAQPPGPLDAGPPLAVVLDEDGPRGIEPALLDEANCRIGHDPETRTDLGLG